jgi:aminodeoxychorismate synthase component I
MTFHHVEEIPDVDRIHGRHAFMLGDRYLGADPVATFRAWRGRRGDDGIRRARVEITTAGGPRLYEAIDPFEALRAFVAENAAQLEAAPFPFRAGLVGYIGYECGQMLERLPCIERPSIGMPDMAFALHRWIIARADGKTWLSILGEDRAEALATRDRVLSSIEHHSSTTVDAALSRDEYIARVAVAKERIARGDAFEICLTNQLRAPYPRDRAWHLFDELRRRSPAPYAAILDLPEGAIVSSSPERFLSLDAQGIAESRPIKGTRPRGSTPESDDALARDLATAEKDRAENAMIVDLVRNDLGRVCRFGSVHTPELYAVEPYANVFHLVSTIRGELSEGKDGIDLLRAAFPPGSMTGAPKIEAMSILEELEPVERGVYSGALGWIDLGGAMDLSVVIRTVILKNGMASFGSGGAVVADSDPIAEYEETQHKARSILEALAAS